MDFMRLNSNSWLANPVLYGNSEERVSDVIDNFSKDLPDNSFYKFTIQVTFVHPVLGGGNKNFIGAKTGDAYEWQIAIDYAHDNLFFRRKNGGTWHDFKRINAV